jgi:hypothetical protein
VKRILLVAFVAVAGCSEAPPVHRSNVADLPAKFQLDCPPPISQGTGLPTGAENGFKVDVDLPAKKFSLSWHPRWQPIKAMISSKIVFVDEHVERGLDNNPMDSKMVFDVRNNTLAYRSKYSAYLPADEKFSVTCKVASHA